MKSEELFIVLASWFLGTIGAVSDLVFYKIYTHLGEGHPIYPSLISIFALIFWGFSVYFSLKYTGLIGRKKHG